MYSDIDKKSNFSYFKKCFIRRKSKKLGMNRRIEEGPADGCSWGQMVFEKKPNRISAGLSVGSQGILWNSWRTPDRPFPITPCTCVRGKGGGCGVDFGGQDVGDVGEEGKELMDNDAYEKYDEDDDDDVADGDDKAANADDDSTDEDADGDDENAAGATDVNGDHETARWSIKAA